MDEYDPANLQAVVDMGSNGIRFSITDLSPKSARSLPTVFQDRAGLSLYDAQYSTGSKGPIPQDAIDEVVSALLRFKCTCDDFEVPKTNIKVLATEATRTAENSEDYRRQVKDATGWEIELLPKEMEGRVGAYGVASSFSSVEGLVMDLGGGSTQITWMVAENGKVETSPRGSFSFPYGAAALSRRLEEISQHHNGDAERETLATQMKGTFEQAYRDLELPERLTNLASSHGLTLYLSGGGFRGWGYLLMSQHRVTPYPIPVINGFQVSVGDFKDTVNVQLLAQSQDTFRVSKRRAAQAPAVAFLINALIEAIPVIEEIRFCQGGVREGYLYNMLDAHVRAIDPLVAATARFASQSSYEIAKVLLDALPGDNKLDRHLPPSFTSPIIQALADTMYLQQSYSKESTSLAALFTPIAGPLASAHGISHSDRALLSLILCRRWDGDIAPPHDSLQGRLRALLSPQEIFWCNYIGAVASVVGDIYPAGRAVKPRIRFQARWSEGLGKRGQHQGVAVVVHVAPGGKDPMTAPLILKSAIEKLEAVGKKKNRIGGRDGYGVPIDVSVEHDLVGDKGGS